MTVVAESAFDMEAIRAEWVGRPLGRSESPYPVEYDPIRRFCHMVGDRNPLFLDPAAARSGPYGQVCCPPGFVRYFAGPGPWPESAAPSPVPREVPTLGDRGINMGVVWTFEQPVLVGDRLATQWRVSDVFEKPTRLDPRSVWIKTEATITNQRDEPVATWTNTVLFHRPVDDASPERPAPPAAGPVEEGPTDGALRRLELDLDPTAVVLQVSGSQDWSLVHHDPSYALDSGHPSIFFNTGWTQGLLSRLLTDHIGSAPRRVESFEFRMVGMNCPGDHVSATAWPAPGTAVGGAAPEHIDLRIANDRVGTTTTGRAVIGELVTT